MRFSWPAFIPSTEISPFFEPVRREISRRLKEMPILESFSGQMTAPSKLMYVDKRFLDPARRPFCLSESTRTIYLSHNYPRHLKDIVCSLGVEEMSNEKFVEHFEQMILEDEKGFRAKPDEWHSEVARTLLPLTEDGALRDNLRRLQIIPLSNGEWVSAISNPHTFHEQSFLGDFQVLNSLRIIHPYAMKNRYRRSLWSSLDIKPIDRQEICQYIVGAHENPVVDPGAWTRAQLVAHARFLYASEWRPSKPIDLWVETSRLCRYRSSRAYYFTVTDHDEPTARVLRKMQSEFPLVLHDDYLISTTASENESKDTPEKAIEDATEIASPQRSHSPEDVSNIERVTNLISEEDDFRQRALESIDSEWEGTSETSDSGTDSSLSTSTYYLEDIADVQRAPYPIFGPGFREFLEWRSLRKDWDDLLQNKNRHDETSASENEDGWHSYLKDVLQVATLPRMAWTSPSPKDRGSLVVHYDFEYLLSVCDASDIFHVLLSNWHHYAHLIEPQRRSNPSEEEELQCLRDVVWHRAKDAESLRDQGTDEPSPTLVRQLKSTKVNVGTRKVALNFCALPDLDPRFDENPQTRLPTLDLKGFSKDERDRLKYLGVSVDSDERYYVKCLRQMKKKAVPSHGTLRQLYEEVQSRYDEREAHLR